MFMMWQGMVVVADVIVDMFGRAWRVREVGQAVLGEFRPDGEKGVGGSVSLIQTPRGEGLLTCLFVPFGKVLVENKEVDWKVD